MANDRLSVFEDSDDIDLSAFKPKTEANPLKPAPEQVRVVSEAARFPSREAVAPVSVAAPTKRTPRWHRTGRTAQLNVRVRPAYFDKAYMLADSRGWLVGETIERALDALEREIGEGHHGS